MLKQFLLALVLFIAVCFSSIAQDEEETIIRTLMQDQQDCWNEGNLSCFMLSYWESDSLMFMGKQGITYGWENTLRRYQLRYPDKATMGKLQFDLKTFIPAGDDEMVVLGKWILLREEDEPSGYFSLLWRKIDGQWKIVLDHTS